MSLFLDNIVKKYETSIACIKQAHGEFFAKKESSGFWHQWSRMHVELFWELNFEQNSNQDNSLDAVTKSFVTKRARMASAFLQGLKTTANEKNSAVILAYKTVLKEHDENFKRQLSEVLKYFSEELIKAQRIRKVTSAYMQSHLSAGG